MFKQLLTLSLLVCASPAFAATYVDGIEDLPLMPGLSQDAGQATVFDQADGRIVESAATATSPAQAIRGFYADSLPQLGWTSAGTDRWTRDGEVLTLDLQSSKTGTRVLFRLSPANLAPSK